MARLAILGIALGVATLLLTQSVLSGFEKVFKESLMDFSAHVAVLRYGGIGQPEELIQQIEKEWGEQIEAVTPFLYRESLLVAGGKVRGAALKGIDPSSFSQVYGVKVNSWLQQGQGLPSANSMKELLNISGKVPSLVLGVDLARDLGVSAEQPFVKVFLPEENSKPSKQKHRFQSFRVTGTFRAGLKELDEGFALLDRESLAQVFGEDPRSSAAATGLEFRLKNPELAPVVAQEMESALGPGYEVYSWQRMNESLFHALRLERILFFVLMSMVVAVAAFNIIGVLVLMIFEKRREISLLRALGSSSRGLRRLWVLQGLSLGGVGVLGGVLIASLLGWGLQKSKLFHLAKEVYWVEELPLQASWWVLLTVIGVTLCFIWLATRFAVREIRRAPLDFS